MHANNGVYCYLVGHGGTDITESSDRGTYNYDTRYDSVHIGIQRGDVFRNPCDTSATVPLTEERATPTFITRRELDDTIRPFSTAIFEQVADLRAAVQALTKVATAAHCIRGGA